MSVHQVHPNFTTLFTSVHFFLLKVNTKLENMKYSSELYLGTIFRKVKVKRLILKVTLRWAWGEMVVFMPFKSKSQKRNPKSDIALLKILAIHVILNIILLS